MEHWGAFLTFPGFELIQLSLHLLLRDYFKDMYHLSFVRLNRNQLSDKGLPKGVFNISTLLDLQLSHNQINSIPMISSHLEHLHLNHNQIESKPTLQQLRLDPSSLISVRSS